MIIASMVLTVIPLTALAPTRCDDPLTAVEDRTCSTPAELGTQVLSTPPAPDPVVAASATAELDFDGSGEVQRGPVRDRIEQLATDVEQARVRAADLAREQRDIEADMESLGEAGGRGGSEAGQRLFERKNAMHEELADLEREIQRLRGETRVDQSEVSDRLDDAASTIEDDKLKERVRWSRGLIGARDGEYIREFEAETARIFEELQEELQRASDAI